MAHQIANAHADMDDQQNLHNFHIHSQLMKFELISRVFHIRILQSVFLIFVTS